MCVHVGLFLCINIHAYTYTCISDIFSFSPRYDNRMQILHDRHQVNSYIIFFDVTVLWREAKKEGMVLNHREQ